MAKREGAVARKLAGSAPIFAALGDETRLRLVASLSTKGPMSIANLTEGTDVTRQAIAKHLRVMELAGLVRSSRKGREAIFQLEPDRLDDARHWLDAIATEWDSALARLAKFVEGLRDRGSTGSAEGLGMGAVIVRATNPFPFLPRFRASCEFWLFAKRRTRSIASIVALRSKRSST